MLWAKADVKHYVRFFPEEKTLRLGVEGDSFACHIRANSDIHSPVEQIAMFTALDLPDSDVHSSVEQTATFAALSSIQRCSQLWICLTAVEGELWRALQCSSLYDTAAKWSVVEEGLLATTWAQQPTCIQMDHDHGRDASLITV